MTPPPSLTWFRALHYGFAEPSATLCLWLAVLPDGRVHCRSELRQQYATIETLARQIRARTRQLQIDRVQYTIADEANIGKEIGDGETRADTFRKNGIPLQVIKPDPLQGWTRIQEMLGVRPDGRPWLTIDPACVHLIKALPNATKHKTDQDDISPFDHDQPLRALRVGLMSRPAPRWLTTPPLPPNAVGRLVDDLRRDATLARPS